MRYFFTIVQVKKISSFHLFLVLNLLKEKITCPRPLVRRKPQTPLPSKTTTRMELPTGALSPSSLPPSLAARDNRAYCESRPNPRAPMATTSSRIAIRRLAQFTPAPSPSLRTHPVSGQEGPVVQGVGAPNASRACRVDCQSASRLLQILRRSLRTS